MHTQYLAGIGFFKRFDSHYSRVEILHDVECLRFRAVAIVNMYLPFTCCQLRSPISKSGRPILEATIGDLSTSRHSGRSPQRRMRSPRSVAPILTDLVPRPKFETKAVARSGLVCDDFLFPSRSRASPHLSTRQYGRIVDSWVEEISLDPAAYRSHSVRRTKPSLIFGGPRTCALCSSCWPHKTAKELDEIEPHNALATNLTIPVMTVEAA